MIRCPKCDYENNDTSPNCAQCHVNLQWALANPEQFKEDKERIILTKEKETKIANLLLTTTSLIQGKMISAYLGVISSFIVLGAGFLTDLEHAIADTFGTRSEGLESKLISAREMVVNKLQEQAIERGGNGIVGLEFDTMTLSGNAIMVSASGTVILFSSQESEILNQ